MTTEQKIEKGIVMLTKRYAERDHFLSDSDVLDVADELVPMDWIKDFDGEGQPLNIVAFAQREQIINALYVACFESAHWNTISAADDAQTEADRDISAAPSPETFTFSAFVADLDQYAGARGEFTLMRGREGSGVRYTLRSLDNFIIEIR